MAKGTRKPAAWETTIDALREKLAIAEVDRDGNFAAFEEAATARDAARTEASTTALELMRVQAEHDGAHELIELLHEQLIGINNALGGDRVCDSEREVRDQAWRLAKVDALKNEIARLRTVLQPFAEYGLRMRYGEPISQVVLDMRVVQPQFPEEKSPHLTCGHFKAAILSLKL